jgi:hypothetical protein
MDDGAALVREVLEDLPMEERGEREEWQRHQGWHRREETHRHPESSPLLPSKEEEPDWEPLPPVAAAEEKKKEKEEEEEESGVRSREEDKEEEKEEEVGSLTARRFGRLGRRSARQGAVARRTARPLLCGAPA